MMRKLLVMSSVAVLGAGSLAEPVPHRYELERRIVCRDGACGRLDSSQLVKKRLSDANGNYRADSMGIGK